MIDQNGGKQENNIFHRCCRWHCCLINEIKNVIIKTN